MWVLWAKEHLNFGSSFITIGIIWFFFATIFDRPVWFFYIGRVKSVMFFFYFLACKVYSAFFIRFFMSRLILRLSSNHHRIFVVYDTCLWPVPLFETWSYWSRLLRFYRFQNEILIVNDCAKTGEKSHETIHVYSVGFK